MKVITVGYSNKTKTIIEQMKRAGIEIYACVSNELSRAKYLAYECNIKNYSDDFDKVIPSNSYDFVYLDLPLEEHYIYAKKALENNKNVIIEKPFTVNQKEANELISIALGRNLLIFEDNHIYQGLTYKTLKQDLSRIGKIRFVEIASSDFVNNKSLLDNLYNPISFVTGLFDIPTTTSYSFLKDDNKELSSTTILKYKDFFVTINTALNTKLYNHISISGENGYIHYEGKINNFDYYDIHSKEGDVKTISYKEYYPYVSSFKNILSIYASKDIRKYDIHAKQILTETKIIDIIKNLL